MGCVARPCTEVAVVHPREEEIVHADVRAELESIHLCQASDSKSATLRIKA
jgi:hypothetical protein